MLRGQSRVGVFPKKLIEWTVPKVPKIVGMQNGGLPQDDL
jgi:hypothetical protein